MNNEPDKKMLTFNTLKEDFTECVFSNGVICRSKIPLVSIDSIMKPDDKKGIGFAFGNPVIFIADFEKGVPGTQDFPKIEESDIQESVEFKYIKTPLNIYEIPDVNKIVFTRLKFNQIRKTKLFDTKGHRIYDFQNLQDVGVFDGPTP